MSLTGFLSYSRVNWQQSPSKSTPLSAANLNTMDAGIKNNNDMISNLRDEVTQLNSNIENLKGLIKSKTFSGVLDYNGAILFNDGEKYLTLENTILLSGFLSPNPNNYRLIIGADNGGYLFATCTPLSSYSVIKDETITVTLFYMEKQ